MMERGWKVFNGSIIGPFIIGTSAIKYSCPISLSQNKYIISILKKIINL